MLFDRQPSCSSLGVRAAIRSPDLTEVSRQLPDPGNLDPRDDLLNLLVADRSRARADDQAGQPLWMPGRVVERHEAAAGDAHQVKSIERQEPGERMQIVGDMPGLLAR